MIYTDLSLALHDELVAALQGLYPSIDVETIKTTRVARVTGTANDLGRLDTTAPVNVLYTLGNAVFHDALIQGVAGIRVQIQCLGADPAVCGDTFEAIFNHFQHGTSFRAQYESGDMYLLDTSTVSRRSGENHPLWQYTSEWEIYQ